MKKFSKAQQEIIHRLWFGDIIHYHYKTGYKFLGGFYVKINHKTICALEDVIHKSMTEDYMVLLTLNSETVEKTEDGFRRKERWFENV